MIVYLARDIPAFVMYCVNGESSSSLLIESTDSNMIGIFPAVRCAVNVLMFLGVSKYPPNAIFRNANINAQGANVTIM